MHGSAISAAAAWRFTLAAVSAGQRTSPFPAFAARLIAVPAEFFAGFHADWRAVPVKVKGIFIYVFTRISFIQAYKSLDIFRQAVTIDSVGIVCGIQQEFCSAVFRQLGFHGKK